MAKLLFRPTLHIGFDVAEGAVARQVGFEGNTGDEGEDGGHSTESPVEELAFEGSPIEHDDGHDDGEGEEQPVGTRMELVAVECLLVFLVFLQQPFAVGLPVGLEVSR